AVTRLDPVGQSLVVTLDPESETGRGPVLRRFDLFVLRTIGHLHCFLYGYAHLAHGARPFLAPLPRDPTTMTNRFIGFCPEIDQAERFRGFYEKILRRLRELGRC